MRLIPAPLDLSAEDLAKLQALYSRSADSVADHLAAVAVEGSAAFMEKYYLNYGHQSIGDCASDTVFIEGVSFLAAKAIQDSALYNGQESSTRYINFQGQGFTDPLGTPESKAILEGWRDLYLQVYHAVTEQLSEETAIAGSVQQRLNAIHARACDIARGYLPLGAQTQLSWTTPLRQFGDRLNLLDHHPLAEVREIATGLRQLLRLQHPHSFKDADYPERAAYLASFGLDLHYATEELEHWHYDRDGDYFEHTAPEGWALDHFPSSQYRLRPAKTELPALFKSLGHFTFDFFLDYGSFRDLQRHRGALIRQPLVTGPLSMHLFYTESLPDALHGSQTFQGAIEAQADRFERFIEREGCRTDTDGPHLAELQNYYPLAQLIPLSWDMDVPQAVYVAELRSTRHVHPTARAIALKMGSAIRAEYPDLALHLDTEALDSFNLARGLQTFVKDL